MGRASVALLWAAILLAVASLVGCASLTSGGGSATTEARPRTYVSIDATSSLDGDILSVSGTTTVPDGSVIEYSMGEGVNKLPGGRVDGAEGPLLVSDGAFAFAQDVSDWPRPIRVYLTFTMKGLQAQPPDVIKLYGADGSKMQGPDVRPFPGLAIAVQELSVGD